MAKKKKTKNKGSQTPRMSVERFLRERVRTLPIGKCYISPPDWRESGEADVIVTRRRSDNSVVMGMFLVDTFCLGVKDVLVNDNMPQHDLEEMLGEMKKGAGLKEISYDEAHNLIYGAVAFAEDAGISPSKEFNTGQYILEEDTDAVPLMEYEYGKDGKHFLVVGPERREIPYIHILRRNLGDDFDYVMPYGEQVNLDDEDDEDDKVELAEDMKDVLEDMMANMEKVKKENARHPREVYSYRHPDYPQALSVKNQFIADELTAPANLKELPREVIDRILALPPDEAAEDIANVLLYTIGKTYRDIDENTEGGSDNSAIMHSLVLLARLNSGKGLDAVLELMRQTEDFCLYHLGDLAFELIHPALYACGSNNVKAIEEYLREPALDSVIRADAVDALVMIVVNHPERRYEVIEALRGLLGSMVDRLPRQEACDGLFAGCIMSSLIDLRAVELIPEIREVFATDCVNKSIAGGADDVIERMKSDARIRHRGKYTLPDIYQEYKDIRGLFNGDEKD